MVSTRSATGSAPATPSPATSQTLTPSTASRRSASSSSSSASWAHTPSNLVLAWLAISLPLVIWDTSYVLLRPHSMPGGSLHKPLFIPYALYGTIDYVYGFPALEAHDGFTAAQAWLNVVETAGYLVYLALVWQYGAEVGGKGRGAPKSKPSADGYMAYLEVLRRPRMVQGSMGVWAALIGFTMSVMTVSKTVLYFLNELCSGFSHIGHNSFATLLPLWIIPNGAWLLLPSYMIYVFGAEILQGLEVASGAGKKRH
ncbi:MAG: hypothetical protein M1828_004954 [Chrysothrix sp. TS-e1954]|nr:MAG: hypothetical protein M1828_004954 [Chrysothrix sp. TS-e1954]